MDEQRLTEIRERLAAAPAGPWRWLEECDWKGNPQGPRYDCEPGLLDADGNLILWLGDGEQYYPTSGHVDGDYDGPTAALIAHSPQDLADLLAEVERETGLRMAFERAVAHLEAETDALARTVLDLRTDLKEARDEALRLRRNPPKDGPRTSSPILGGGL